MKWAYHEGMSDHLTRIIPEDPRFVPTPAGEERGLAVLRAFLPQDEVTAKHFGCVEFVDQGENFERVLCPHCQAEISMEEWGDWIDRSYSSGFADLVGRTPCCDQPSDLNSLIYEMPAGFASFMFEIWNAHVGDGRGGFVPDEVTVAVSEALGCPVRQVLTWI
jgi:hypothetical protein